LRLKSGRRDQPHGYRFSVRNPVPARAFYRVSEGVTEVEALANAEVFWIGSNVSRFDPENLLDEPSEIGWNSAFVHCTLL
jgi:hypothetical protein